MRLPIFTRPIKIITIIAIVLVLYIPYFVKILHKNLSINLKRKPEGTTELFFSDHLNLPKQIEVGKPYSFEFTTHNLEYRELTYAYEVVISDGGEGGIVEKSEFVLPDGQTKIVDVPLILSKSFGRAKVIVKLLNENQEINFWVDEEI